MIVREFYVTRRNGVDLYHTYSVAAYKTADGWKDYEIYIVAM